ncbi:MAG: Mut7-C RNAse domain-containing protein [Nitrososphaerales archaeon]
MNATAAEQLFVVDGMLGTLARKLRIFGFDTLYYNDAEDERLVEVAIKDGRVLLTSDRTLFQIAAKRGARSILLAGENDLDDFAHVLSSLGIAGIEFASERSRCSLCNGVLEERAKDSVKDLVPAGLLERHSRFYLCSKCRKVYWEGSHIKKMQEFARGVNGRLTKER